MADDNSANLRALEVLMDEFFSPTTTNARKAEIEKVLANFSGQAAAWKDCLFFLTNTNNHYVCMFSLTTLETFIHRRWVGMLGSDRAEIRTNLNNFLFQHHTTAPQFIKNKLIKLIVDIARSDWPHFYPEFFTQIMSLLTPTTPSTTTLGLTMILTCSEELATPREDISTSRAVELRKLMTAQVSHISLSLTSMLELVLDKDSQSRTPPPSPSVSNDSEDSNSMDGPNIPVFTSSPLHTGSLLHAASLKVLSQSRKSSPVVQLPLDQQSRDIAELCLKCLAHIFTWANLSLTVSSRLINVLFQYASLEVKSQGSDDVSTALSVLAMGAINEIIYKNFVPQDFNDYLVIMFRNSFHLLQSLVMDQSNSAKLAELDETFIEKMTEFLRLFVSIHLRRCEQNPQFPLLEFLALMFKYSFQQTNLQGFFSCLEIWGGVVDYIQGSLETRKETGVALLAKYQEALLSLVMELLKKIQWRVNSQQLVQLDDEVVTADGNTEWQQFLYTIIELIMKVAELLPEDVLRIIDLAWRETSQTYLELEKVVCEKEGSRVFTIQSDEEVEKLKAILKDFASMLQLIGRLSAMFLGQHFLPRLKIGLEYVKQLLVLATFGSKQKLWTVNVNFSSKYRINPSFVTCHAQTMAALKAWCHWLAALHSESLQDSSYTWICSDLTSSIVRAVVTVIKDTSSPDLTHSAAHFLVTLTGTVRPPSIWKLKDFTDLYNMIHHLNLQNEAHRLLVRSLCNVLLLHWPGIQEQKWDDRKKHLSKFLRDLTERFRSLKTQTSFATDKHLQQQAEPVIIHTLQLLGDLVENVLNEVTQTKKLCHDISRDYIETSLWLFPLYYHNSKVCEEMFHFFHIVFDVLKTQMGAPFVELAVQTFFSLYGQNQLTEVILQKKGSTETKVVEKFLSILTFIVSEPGTTFRKFVSSTLSLCLETIYPLIVDQQSSDLKGPLYNLLYHTLLHNWNFFFKSNLKSFNNLNNNNADEIENKDAFLGVMKAIGQSFLQADIAVFSQNVATLEHLNSKWRLYSKTVFKETLLAEFLSVFLKVLITKSHNLLKEEIGVAIFNMGSTDIPTFFSKFVPQFLLSVENLDDSQRQILTASFKPESDMPSFVANLDRFINDLRYYQLVNSSVPQGSVKF